MIWSKTLKLPFANPKMTKDLSPAMSTSKLFPLPVTTVTSPSLYTSYLVYNLLCYEVWNFLFLTACMKCEVYLERFFQILKLVTGDWNTFLRNVWYWWKSSINHFTVCIDKSFNHICNCKQLDTYYLFDEIANYMETVTLCHYLWDMVMLKLVWGNWMKPWKNFLLN